MLSNLTGTWTWPRACQYKEIQVNTLNIIVIPKFSKAFNQLYVLYKAYPYFSGSRFFHSPRRQPRLNIDTFVYFDIMTLFKFVLTWIIQVLVITE